MSKYLYICNDTHIIIINYKHSLGKVYRQIKQTAYKNTVEYNLRSMFVV